jgi:hypothetical protein
LDIEGVGRLCTIRDLVQREETNGSPSGCWAIVERERSVREGERGGAECEDIYLDMTKLKAMRSSWELWQFSFAPRSGHFDIAELRYVSLQKTLEKNIYSNLNVSTLSGNKKKGHPQPEPKRSAPKNPVGTRKSSRHLSAEPG